MKVRPFVIALGLGLLCRLALALGTDIYADEAYYWTWAQRLDWSYYDHPPLTAWFIRVFGIRPGALLQGGLTVAVAALFAKDLHRSTDAALRAAALTATLPAAILAGVFNTPDTPLHLFWLLSLWALHKERWVLAGFACGFALLAKYPAVLLALVFVADALARRRLRPGAFVTAALALALFLPVILWNAHRDFLGFGFQMAHGLGGSGGLATFAEFVGGQVAMSGGVLGVLALVWAMRPQRFGQDPVHTRLLRYAVFVPLVVFGLASLRSRGEANWAAVAWLSACVGLAGVRTRWVTAAAVVGALIALVGTSHLLLPVVRAQREPPISRLHGWEVLAGLREEAAAAVYAPSYQLAAQAAYYGRLPSGVAGDARKSQFDLWPEPVVPTGADALWLSEGPPPPQALAQRFERVEALPVLETSYRGKVVHTFHVFRLINRR